MHNAPAGALACHCIELSLKAVLLGVNLLMPHYAPLRRGFSLRGSPAVCREAEKNWGRRCQPAPFARAILRVFGTTNKHHAEQHVGFDGNRDDPFDGLLAARARK